MAIKSKDLTLAEMLRQGTFIVPRHQRSYDWGERHVQDLLDDLEFCIDNKQDEHFLGSIMLIGDPSPDNNKWVINDGQQRIMTYNLLCANLSQRFELSGYSESEELMLRVLFDAKDGVALSRDNIGGYHARVKIRSHEMTAYQALITGNEIQRNENISRAWKAIERFLNKERDQKEKWLKSLMEFILHKLTVVVVYVSGKSDVNAIFETLNGRGKQLRQIHLVQNYIYSHFVTDDARSNAVEQKIKMMTQVMLKDIDMEKYVYCSAQARYGYMSSKDFYRDFRKHIKDNFSGVRKEKEEVYSLVENLGVLHKIEIFRALAGKSESAKEQLLDKLTKDAEQESANRKINCYIRDITKYTVAYPVMFALLCLYADSNTTPGERKATARFVYRASRYLASFIQRVSHVTGSFPASTFAKKLAELARKVNEEECNTPRSFLEEIKDMDFLDVINDASYKEKLKIMSFESSPAKAKHILAGIVEYRGQDVDQKKCVIEHILPKSTRHLQHWKKFDSDEHRTYVHRLGNLTLLKSSENKSGVGKNSSFSTKKKIYRDSCYKITRDTSNVKGDWSPQEIKKRQGMLMKIAVQVWDFQV